MIRTSCYTNRISSPLQRRDNFAEAMASTFLSLVFLTSLMQAQTFTVLHRFGGKSDGSNPRAGLIRDADGNLYGTTWQGGDLNCRSNYGCGTVFRLDGKNKETILHAFAGVTDGEGPSASLLRDAAGNLYGTTVSGPAHLYGTVFKIDTSGKLIVLHVFSGGADGAFPYSALIADKTGNLYGTTFNGGVHGDGVVFKVSTSGKLTVLHSFSGGTQDGLLPLAGLLLDAVGNLYGTTTEGGYMGNGCRVVNGCGVVFKLAKNGELTLLYSFTNSSDGAVPKSRLVSDGAGGFYGTTSSAGDVTCDPPFGCGNVFKLDGSGKLTPLHNFSGEADGAFPAGDLILDASSNIYGATAEGGDLACDQDFGCGIVFKVDSTGVLTVLHTFTGGLEGDTPEAGLIRDAAGTLFGTTDVGGDRNRGIVFKIVP
jgi:uncharacterized repeat protein (TIGR03803 family)